MDDEDKPTALTRPLLRRVVTGVGPDGRSGVMSDGPPPVAYRYGSGAMAMKGVLGDTGPPAETEGLLTELWAARLDPGRATSVRSADDPTRPDPRCEVECEPGKIKWRLVRFGPNRETALHATATMDCSVVVAGGSSWSWSPGGRGSVRVTPSSCRAWSTDGGPDPRDAP